MSKPRALSHRIESIEYVHADDGMPYRHDFTRGDSDITLRKDGSVLIRNKKRRLWDVFTMKDGKQQPFLVNPRGVRDSQSRKKKMAKRRKTTKRRRNPTTTARRRSSTPRKRTRRRTNVYASAIANPPARRRRRHHRRNPPFSVNGLLRTATDGLMDGALVVGGKTIARLVSSQFPYQDGSMMDSFIEVGTAIALGMVAPRFLGNDRARFLVAGAFASPLETLAAQANIPRVSSLLGKVGRVGDNTSVVYAPADAGIFREGSAGPGSGASLSAYPTNRRLDPGPALGAYATRAATMQS